MESDRPRFVGATAGVDCHGVPVRLGEFDSAGHIVGYIDEDTGSCWESLRERDCSITAGRFDEATARFRRGEVSVAPDPDEIARQHCIDPANREQAARDAREQLEFYDRLRAALPALGAQLIEPGGTTVEEARRVMAQFLVWMLREQVQLESLDDLRPAFRRWLEER